MPENVENGNEGHGDAEIDVPVQDVDVPRRTVAVVDEEGQQNAQQARDEAGDAQGDVPDFPVGRFSHLVGFYQDEGDQVQSEGDAQDGEQRVTERLGWFGRGLLHFGDVLRNILDGSFFLDGFGFGDSRHFLLRVGRLSVVYSCGGLFRGWGFGRLCRLLGGCRGLLFGGKLSVVAEAVAVGIHETAADAGTVNLWAVLLCHCRHHGKNSE